MQKQEHLRAKGAPKESGLDYRLLIENSSDVIFCSDAAGRYKFVNRVFSSAFGKEPEYFKDKTLWDVYSKEQADYRFAAITKVFRTGERVELDVEVPLPGRTLYFKARINPVKDEAGRVILALTNSTEITEQRHTEEALRRSRFKYQELVDNAGIGVFRTRLDGSAVLEANDQCLRIFGRTRDELPGLTMADNWADLKEREEIVSRLKTEGRVENVECRIRRKNGEIRDCLATVTLDQEQGTAEGILLDITPRRQAEREKDRVNQELTRKKEEMESFLYITTHDMRTPLVNIQGFAQQLRKHLAELSRIVKAADLDGKAEARALHLAEESVPEALNFVADSADRMDKMIAALLKMSRLGRVAPHPREVDMNALLREARAGLEYRLNELGGKVVIGPLPPCHADPELVSQIFMNLLDNALKYRQKGRKAEIRITGGLTPEGLARYSVKDNGAGIKAEELRKVWDIFYRAKNHCGEQGEGVGLTMTRRLTELSGGSIRAESVPGEGSTFFVELPAVSGRVILDK